MVLTQAQKNAKNLLLEMCIEDPNYELRNACAHLWLSLSVLRIPRKQAARGDSGPLQKIAETLENRGVSSGMARRICGFPALESDGLKRRLDGATDGGPASSSKAARAAPANDAQSETDAESDGA